MFLREAAEHLSYNWNNISILLYLWISGCEVPYISKMIYQHLSESYVMCAIPINNQWNERGNYEKIKR